MLALQLRANAMHDAGADLAAARERARNVLQKGVAP
jgi:hypothetical protein